MFWEGIKTVFEYLLSDIIKVEATIIIETDAGR